MALSVLFVVPRFHTNLYFATRALIEAGHDVKVVAATSELLEDHGTLSPHILSPDAPDAALTAVLDECAPDLALLRNDAAGLGQRFGLKCRARRINAYTYNIRPQDWRPRLSRRIAMWREGLPWRRVTPVPAPNGAVRTDRWARLLPWPVAARGPLARQGKVTGSPLRVLCVGKLCQPRKQQDALIDAMRPGLAGGRMTLTLVGASSDDMTISGVDPEHFRRLQAAQRSFPNAIRIVSDLPFAEMAGLYASHDVCVLPARGEPLGVAPIESMAYGCVPIISDGCGSAGYLADGETGFVYGAADTDRLGGVLERLAAEPALRDRVGTAARHLAETEFSPARFTARIEALAAKRRIES